MDYSKNNQLAVKDKGKMALEIPSPIELHKGICLRNYSPQSMAIYESMSLAIAEGIPTELKKPFRILAMRQGGKRIGVDYGIVEEEEVEKVVLALIPQFCFFLGVRWEDTYLVFAKGIAIHLIHNFPLFTIEELKYLHSGVFMIPPESIPEAYQAFKMSCFTDIIKAYVKHVFPMGAKAGLYLRDNYMPKYEDRDRSLEDRSIFDTPEKIDNLYGRLVNAYSLALEISEGLDPYELAKKACKSPNDAFEIGEFVIGKLLSLDGASLQEAYSLSLEKVKVESCSKSGYQMFIDLGKSQNVRPEALFKASACLNISVLGHLINKWKGEGLSSPPPIE